jgi:hypothetical protein
MLVIAALWAWCLLVPAKTVPLSDAERAASLEAVFASIDVNHDGQLDASETERFAAASLDPQQEGWSAAAAGAASRGALDGPDAGATVSREEVVAHLAALMQARLPCMQGPPCCSSLGTPVARASHTCCGQLLPAPPVQ